MVDSLCQSLDRQQQNEWEEPELQESHKFSLVVGHADKRRRINSWKKDPLRAIQHKNIASGSGNSLTANSPKDRL